MRETSRLSFLKWMREIMRCTNACVFAQQPDTRRPGASSESDINEENKQHSLLCLSLNRTMVPGGFVPPGEPSTAPCAGGDVAQASSNDITSWCARDFRVSRRLRGVDFCPENSCSRQRQPSLPSSANTTKKQISCLALSPLESI